MILVDTSVWVDHLRDGDDGLRAVLHDGHVVTHPFVIGELACGVIRRRDEVLELLRALPAARIASHGEALGLVETHRLAGAGMGWIDVHLLAAARLSHFQLWTRDQRLLAAARRLNVAYS